MKFHLTITDTEVTVRASMSGDGGLIGDFSETHKKGSSQYESLTKLGEGEISQSDFEKATSQKPSK